MRLQTIVVRVARSSIPAISPAQVRFTQFYFFYTLSVITALHRKHVLLLDRALVVPCHFLIVIILLILKGKVGMRYQAKLLTLSPQIVSKMSYLSILVNDEF